jgi:hypothetical protein
MSDSLQMWVEIGFNLAYLAVIWLLVLLMTLRLGSLAHGRKRPARLFVWAFALLALGDTGHVGFRVLAYALGGLEARLKLAGVELGLVGAGAFSTAFTVTIFYMLFVFIWSERFDRPLGFTGWLLLLMGAGRIILMLFPQNEWDRVIAPQPWAWIRNIPLVFQGLGVAFLIFRDASATADRTFRWIAWMILLSFAFYAPVILFVAQIPALGMLMIPKTLAYVAIAFIAYRELFQPNAVSNGSELLTQEQ